MATLGNSWTTIASGSFTKNQATLTYSIEAKLDSQNTSKNQSSIITRAKTSFSGYSMSSYNVHMSCTGCTSYNGNNSTIYYFGNNDSVLGNGSVTVNHNADGTGSLSMSGSCTGNLGMNISVSGSIDLPKINRYSVITSFNNFNIEDGFSIGYTDYLSSKDLTLTCKMGNTTVATKTYKSSAGAHTDTITFNSTALNSIYNGIGSSNKSATFTLTLSTSGITTTSSKEATGTLKSSANAPSITGLPTVVETNATMISCGVADTEIVRYLSSKRITASATAQHGAGIGSVKIKNGSSGSEVSMTLSSGSYTATLNNLTANTFILTVTDTRGFTASKTVTCTIKNYSRPSVEKIEFDRTTSITTTGYIRPKGKYWFGSAGNTTNSVTWKYRISSGSISSSQTATCVGTSWNGETTLPSGTLLRENSYECTVTVFDAFGQTATSTVSIGPAKLSAWIGKETIKAEGFVGAHYLGVFPVGAIYMSTTATNPSTYFGGTWVQIAQGRTIVGVGSVQANTVDTWGSVTPGAFNPAVTERGGTFSHRHYMHGLDDDGPRAAIGATDSDVHSIGYYISSPSAWGPAYTTRYSVSGSVKDYSDGVQHTFNHYTPVFGYARGSSVVLPYLAVYIWRRTA